MSVASNLTLAGRRFHEQIMDDACTITRAGTRTLNETTGLYSQTPTTVYTGACRVVVPPRHPQDVVLTGQVEVVQTARLDLPVAASAGVRDGDVATFTASVDPALVGLKYRLKGVPGQTHGTARRFFMEAYA